MIHMFHLTHIKRWGSNGMDEAFHRPPLHQLFEKHSLEYALYQLVESEYRLNDDGHQLSHLKEVLSRSIGLSHMEYSDSDNIVRRWVEVHLIAAVVFHDMFSRFRDIHHLLAADWVMYNKDRIAEIITEYYPYISKSNHDIDFEMIATAIREHRASVDGKYDYDTKFKFTSLISEIIAVADKSEPRTDMTIFTRALQYREGQGLSYIDIVQGAYNHVIEKFGEFKFAEFSPLYKKIYGRQEEARRAFLKTVTLDELMSFYCGSIKSYVKEFMVMDFVKFITTEDNLRTVNKLVNSHNSNTDNKMIRESETTYRIETDNQKLRIREGEYLFHISNGQFIVLTEEQFESFGK